MADYILYTRRWYILLLSCSIFFFGTFLTNQWSVIYKALQLIYNWKTTEIAILPFYGAALFPFLVLPSSWILERFGLRKSMIIMTLAIFIGTAIRCIPGSNRIETVLINAGAVFVGISYIMGSFIPVYVTAHWFGPHERKIATSLGNLAPILGLGFSFLIAPLAVPGDESYELTLNRFRVYMYAEAGVGLLLLLLVLLYFPDRPPTPSSATSSIPRTNFLEGVKTLASSTTFYRSAFPVVWLYSGMTAYSTTLAILLGPFGVNEGNAGLLGFGGVVSGIALGVVIAKLCDTIGHVKAFVVALSVIACEGMIWFTLVYTGILPFTMSQMWFCTIFANGAVTPTISLSMEVAADANYPVSEPVTVAAMMMITNLVIAIILVLVVFVSISNHTWIVIYFTTAIIIGAISCAISPTKMKRSELDNQVGNVSKPVSQPLDSSSTEKTPTKKELDPITHSKEGHTDAAHPPARCGH